MKIVYYSNIFFTDCDFPLVKAFQQRNDEIIYFIEIVLTKQNGGLFNLQNASIHEGIIEASKIDEFQKYSDYIDLSKIFLIVRKPGAFHFKSWWIYIKLCRIILNFSPDVLHITQALGLIESLLYVFKNKMVMTVHDPFLHSGERIHSVERKRKRAFSNAKKLILLNKTQQQDFSQFYKISSKKIFQNSLGCYECIKLEKDQPKTCDEKYILFFGHISPYKGVDILCQAMDLVHKDMPNLKCIIAGKGSFDFNKAAYDQNDFICFYNRFIDLPELKSLIQNSLFVVCPYKDATQSGVVLSSFALNKPVIASDVGAMKETINDGENGLLVPPNNALELANAIIRLAQNDLLQQEMSSHIEKKYSDGEQSWNSIISKYTEIYESIV